MNYRNYNNATNYFWVGLIIFIFLGGFRTLLLLIPVIFIFIPIFIIGFIFTQLIKAISKNATINSGLSGATLERRYFVELFTRLLIHLARSDGKVDQSEIQAIRQFFISQLQFNSPQVQWIDDIIYSAKNHSYSIDELIYELQTKFNQSVHILLIELLYHVAQSDGTISKSEIDLINYIVVKLNISDFDHARIRAQYKLNQTNSKNYYSILGVSENATQEEIKKAYKDAVKKYHPDTVQHLGEDFKKVAEEKFKAVTEAYNYLKK